MEQAIYVPAHRRASEQATSSTSRRTEDDRERERERDREREREREKDRERARERSPIRRSDYRRSTRTSDTRSHDEPRDLREKVNKQRNRDIELRSTRLRRDASGERRDAREARETNRTEEKPSVTNRIGSRVFVPPSKPEHSKVEEVDDDEPIEVPVNSVVKVKPRPLIPRSKQASKNLLLRAVAEAQKSTALVKPQREATSTLRGPKELYTKSFRKKLHKDHIVVEVATDDMDDAKMIDAVDELEVELEEEVEEEEEEGEGEGEEEYVPQVVQATPIEDVIEDDPFIYIPQSIHNNG